MPRPKKYNTEAERLEAVRRQTKARVKKYRESTGVYTLYLIYKKDLSEYYIGMTSKKFGLRKTGHFSKNLNRSPFAGKSTKDYNHTILYTTKSHKECNDLEREIIRTLTDDVRLLNKVYRG